jgi:ferredoxin-NADP reductase
MPPTTTAATAANFSRILCIAGGIGATYIIPLWRSLVLLPAPAQERRLVWAVRSAAETAWALPALAADKDARAAGQDAEVEAFDLDEMEMYVTRRAGPTRDDDGGDVELSDLGRQERATVTGGSQSAVTPQSVGFVVHRGIRPSLRGIVDEVFAGGNDGRVAIFVCGPAGMGRVVRKEAGRWVRKGRDVFLHVEEFGL